MVVIERPDSRTFRKKKVEVVLDGKRAATITNGETLHLSVPEGKHTLNVALDYFAGKKLTLEAMTGGTYYYTVTPSKTYRYSIPFIIIILMINAVPERILPFWLNITLVIALGLPLIIWRLVSKDAYFNLKEQPQQEAVAVTAG